MKSFWLATTGLVVAAALSGVAEAAPITGSDSVIVAGVTTSPAVDLLTTVSSGGTVTLSSNFWGSGGTGDFSGLAAFANPIADTNLSFAPGGLGAFSFTSALGNFVGSSSITVGPNTFTSQVLGTTGSAGSGAETVSLYLVGTFTPSGALPGTDPDNMSISLTLNENGIGTTPNQPLGSFGASFTVAAPASAPPPPPPPPPTNVPEPMSVMMLGAGLFGLGAVRRRRS